MSKISPKQLNIPELKRTLVTDRYPTFVFGVIVQGKLGSPLRIPFDAKVKSVIAYCTTASEVETKITVNKKWLKDADWSSLLTEEQYITISSTNLTPNPVELDEPLLIERGTLLQVEFIEADKDLKELTVQVELEV